MPLIRSHYLNLNENGNYQLEYFGDYNGILKSFTISVSKDQLQKEFTQDQLLSTMDVLAKDQYETWKKQAISSNLNVNLTQMPQKTIIED